LTSFKELRWKKTQSVPPKHIVKQEQLEIFYNTFGQRFIAGSDYNAKHTAWGSRVTTQDLLPRDTTPLKHSPHKLGLLSPSYH
jgi:hypothetical protein